MSGRYPKAVRMERLAVSGHCLTVSSENGCVSSAGVARGYDVVERGCESEGRGYDDAGLGYDCGNANVETVKRLKMQRMKTERAKEEVWLTVLKRT